MEQGEAETGVSKRGRGIIAPHSTGCEIRCHPTTDIRPQMAVGGGSEREAESVRTPLSHEALSPQPPGGGLATPQGAGAAISGTDVSQERGC